MTKKEKRPEKTLVAQIKNQGYKKHIMNRICSVLTSWEIFGTEQLKDAMEALDLMTSINWDTEEKKPIIKSLFILFSSSEVPINIRKSVGININNTLKNKRILKMFLRDSGEAQLALQPMFTILKEAEEF